MDKEIRVLLVDDHALVREGIKTMLTGEGIDVVGGVSSGEEAIEAAQQHMPDVILMDIMLKGEMNGIEATRWIRERQPDIRIMLLSMEIKKEFLSAGIQCGISGYLHKDVSRETLLKAVREIYEGNKYFNEAITNLVFEDYYNKAKTAPAPAKTPALTPLSRREEDVLAHVAQGLSNREVAERLFISVKTVETHKAHILDKLGLRNTAELVKYAVKHNIVPL